MTDSVEKQPFPPRWLKWAMGFMGFIVVGGVLFGIFGQLAIIQDKNTAQANSQTLAQDIRTVCDSQGKLMVDDRDLCAKATQVQQSPTEAIAGPKGDPGNDGLPGKTGTAGPAGSEGPTGAKGDKGDIGPLGPVGAQGNQGVEGIDSTATGPAGPAGADGVPGPMGPPGPAGAEGPAGADSTTPGPEGAKGADGKSPESFTFTDATGTGYTCTPVPPGSATYTCTAAPLIGATP